MGGWSDGLFGQSDDAKKSVSVRKGILRIFARIGTRMSCALHLTSSRFSSVASNARRLKSLGLTQITI